VDRRTFCMISFIALGGMLGCHSSQTTPPRPLTKAEIERLMSKALKLQVKLTDHGSGRFSGTGKNPSGQVAEVEVTQDERQFNWTAKAGGRSISGSISR
jgi:hypothetical protein